MELDITRITQGPRSPRGGGPSRHRREVPLLAWPVGLALLLLALWTWRGSDAAGDVPATPPEPVVVRSVGPARLELPRSWQQLQRTDAHATWGTSDRSHTVTLASTEASALPLPAVVRELTAQSDQLLPGARRVGQPVELQLPEPAARGDAAMLVRFRLPTAQGQELRVVQVWRRDVRAAIDLVATWTSGDDSWPVAPRDAVPQAVSSR